MTIAKDIMTKDVIVVTPDTPISIVIKILAIRKVTGLPVVDENKKLLGIVSEKDLMGLLLQDNIDANLNIEKFMTKEVKSFSPEDDVKTVCEFLLNKPFRRVPITEGGKLLGLISRADIIKLLWANMADNK